MRGVATFVGVAGRRTGPRADCFERGDRLRSALAPRMRFARPLGRLSVRVLSVRMRSVRVRSVPALSIRVLSIPVLSVRMPSVGA